MELFLPTLNTGITNIDRAFRIAIGDFTGNIVHHCSGLLESPQPVIIAGLDYVRPWTRDAAFNTWYAGGLLCPETARNTLLAVLCRYPKLRIDGQYWDAIIWAQGAWSYYTYTGDHDFLKIAQEAIENSLRYFEETEFDTKDGLFRGGACFQDGIAAYPNKFVSSHNGSGIMSCIRDNPDFLAPVGGKIPTKAMSTNCLYYMAYKIAENIRKELSQPELNSCAIKAKKLKDAINTHFWNSPKGTYRYLLDTEDTTDRQEGLGHAFAILSGVASKEQYDEIMHNQFITPNGIACVWPQYERYSSFSENGFARHSGTIWPQVNTAWAKACIQAGYPEKGWNELKSLADKACRDKQFVEIYHPLSGEPYGGLQESPEANGITEWESCNRQTWCATGYINMVISVLFGMKFNSNGIDFKPFLPEKMITISLKGLKYRRQILDITISKGGNEKFIEINGSKSKMLKLEADGTGRKEIIINI